MCYAVSDIVGAYDRESRGEIMVHITDWLSIIGDHFWLIAVGCLEAVVALVLLGLTLGKKKRPVLPSEGRESENELLRLVDQKDISKRQGNKAEVVAKVR